MRKKQYCGKLSPEAAAAGIDAALKNAKSLLVDATLLFENDRYQRAAALAILAIEEAGKPAILRTILLVDQPQELKNEWRDYRKHTAKNAGWIVPELIDKGARHIEDMRPTVDKSSTHRETLDNLKQLAFYSDVFSDCQWSIPSQVIDKALAQTILDIAHAIVINRKSSMVTTVELELWVKHLKGVWNKDMSDMKRALVNCYQEAEELGLIESGMTQRMSDFVV